MSCAVQTCSAGEEDDGTRWAWPLMGQVRLLCEPISRIRILTSGLRDELGRALGPRAVHRGVAFCAAKCHGPLLKKKSHDPPACLTTGA